jgi:serine/threonine protein kinase
LSCIFHFVDRPQSWKWQESSKVHRQKFVNLFDYGREHPEEIKEINGVRVCFADEFCIGRGSDGTRVYVGLGNDGVERAVKRMRRDACSCLAEHEKQVLSEHNTSKSNYVVNYWFLDEKRDIEYLFLILDLCEETLEDFVDSSSLEYLVTIAPDIIKQVLKGLADLHRGSMPILHRDLKPSNILRNVQGNWLLADFGISRIMTEDPSTIRTNPKGTKDWRAVETYHPEGRSADGKVRYKKETDVQVKFS